MAVEINLRRSRGWPGTSPTQRCLWGEPQTVMRARSWKLRRLGCSVNRPLAVRAVEAAFSCHRGTCEEMDKHQGQLERRGPAGWLTAGGCRGHLERVGTDSPAPIRLPRLPEVLVSRPESGRKRPERCPRPPDGSRRRQRLRRLAPGPGRARESRSVERIGVAIET